MLPVIFPAFNARGIKYPFLFLSPSPSLYVGKVKPGEEKGKETDSTSFLAFLFMVSWIYPNRRISVQKTGAISLASWPQRVLPSPIHQRQPIAFPIDVLLSSRS